MSLVFSKITDQDREFLYRVFRSTRLDELTPLGWTAEQITAFLMMQFNAQHTYYQNTFPDASYQIVWLDGQPIGRLYLERRNDGLHIIDIALLPEFRNRGIGSLLLQDIIRQGEAQGIPVQIYVEQYNPALRLYHRLGFRQIGYTGVYFLMERVPGPLTETTQPASDSSGAMAGL